MAAPDRRTGTGGGAVRGVGRALSLLAAFVAMSVVGGVLAAGLLMPAVGATGSLARTGVDAFESLPAELEIQPLSQQSKILAADGSTIATFYAQNRVLVPLDQMAPVMRQAMVAIEDSRFYEHNGVDPQGLVRAAVNNASGGDTQGASTLTQQYVKNVLLEQAVAAGDEEAARAAVVSEGTEGYARKAREAKLAIALEKQLTKDEILERYLNIALFADQVYGVQAASQYFFGKNAADLAVHEAAMIAGLVQSPGRYNPRTNPEAALERRNIVLRRMLDTGAIDQPTHDAAVAAPLGVNVQPVTNGCEGAGSAAYFCEYVYRVMLQDPTFGDTPEERRRLVFTGGLTIRTTLDPRLQQIAQQSVEQSIPIGDPSGKVAAAVTLDPSTGKVLAMAQSTRYSQEEGVQGATKINMTVDASLGGRDGNQPGSNFKPVVLAAWLAAGKTLNTVVDAPVEGSDEYDEFTSTCGRLVSPDGEPYEYSNVEGLGGGRMTVMEATYRSVNTAYINMQKELDLCQIREMANRLGIRDSRGNDVKVVPSMALGVDYVSNMTMATGFGTFATRGLRCEALAITEVVDADGARIAAPQPACEQVIPQDVADGVNYALQRTLTEGTARCCALDVPAAGKTGTTNSLADTWFTGYTPNLVTSVWVGDPRGDTYNMRDIQINGRYYRNVYGSSIAAPTWERIMGPAVDALGQPATPFRNPPTRMLAPGISVTEDEDERPRRFGGPAEDRNNDRNDDRNNDRDDDRTDRSGARAGAPAPEPVTPAPEPDLGVDPDLDLGGDDAPGQGRGPGGEGPPGLDPPSDD